MSSVHHRPSSILRLLSCVICPLIALGTSSAAALQIVLPSECGEKAHRIAAQELARYWQEICGVLDVSAVIEHAENGNAPQLAIDVVENVVVLYAHVSCFP